MFGDIRDDQWADRDRDRDGVCPTNVVDTYISTVHRNLWSLPEEGGGGWP